MKTAISENVIAITVKPISPDPFIAASYGERPSSICRTMFSTSTTPSSTTKPTAIDKAIKEEVVETVAEFVEHREGTDQCQGHGDGRNNGRPEITQEYEDHHDDERNRQQQGELHVVDRGTDGLGAIGNDIYLDGGRDRGLEHRHHRLDPAPRLDDVVARRGQDRQKDCPLLVEPSGNQLVLSRADGAADIAYADRRPVAIGDDQVGVFVGLEQLIVGIERVG